MTITKLLNDMVDKVRRTEYARREGEGLKLLKGHRFLLLRNFGNLDGEQKSTLKTLLDVNQPLAVAHSMKEQFRCFWDCGSRAEGVFFLCRWFTEAINSGIQALMKTARTLLDRAEGLLSYFDHRIDNGKAEGINNKIKVLKRRAYGFRDQQYFKLRLYHLHKKEYQLMG
jgi:transposase